MAVQTHYHTVGDTLTPLGATLERDGSAVDLTGKTVQFKMVLASDGTVKQNWTAATVVSAAAGTVEYDFTSGNVDTAGDYFAWFRAVSGGEYDTFPVGRDFKIKLRNAS